MTSENSAQFRRGNPLEMLLRNPWRSTAAIAGLLTLVVSETAGFATLFVGEGRAALWLCLLVAPTLFVLGFFFTTPWLRLFGFPASLLVTLALVRGEATALVWSPALYVVWATALLTYMFATSATHGAGDADADDRVEPLDYKRRMPNPTMLRSRAAYLVASFAAVATGLWLADDQSWMTTGTAARHSMVRILIALFSWLLLAYVSFGAPLLDAGYLLAQYRRMSKGARARAWLARVAALAAVAGAYAIYFWALAAVPE